MSRETSLVRATLGGWGRWMPGLAYGIALILLLSMVLANPAKAVTFTVNSTADAKDANAGDGECATESGECTLRAAIEEANALPGEDTITFGLPANSTIELTSGRDLNISSDLSIEGPGEDQLTVDGVSSQSENRVFRINTGANASIAGLTATGGIVGDGGSDTFGGGIRTDGGGIFIDNGGKLTIANTTISDNSGAIGGGIRNDGVLTVNNSTISGNTASEAGGGIDNDYGVLTLNKSTISGNTAGSGGGIDNDYGRLTVNSSTISGNEGSFGGGGVFNFEGLTVIENSTITKNIAPQDSGAGVASFGDPDTRTDVRASIISENTGTDVDLVFGSENPFESLGSNLVGDGNATGAFTAANNDQVGVENPDLGDLADNGGPTWTHAVQPDSPALDAVEPAGTSAAATQEPCGVTEDQRGVSRPKDGDGDGTANCDVGSFELEQPFVQITPEAENFGNQQEGTQSAPQTFTVENTGAAPLQIETVSIAGADAAAFTKPSDNCEGSTLAPGDTCTVEVVFSPDSAGDKSAVLRVQSDASSSSDAPTSSEASTDFDEAQLSGSGTAIPVPPPVIDIPIVDTPPIRPPSIKPPATNIKPPNNKACTIKGNNKDDVLRGTPKRDVICGFGGNDRIRGLGGNDIIKGGRGHDIIYGNKGNDKLFGQKGNDALFGGKGRDVLLGGKGKNALVGGKGKDVERGGVAPADTKKQTKKLTKKVIKDIFKQVGVR